MILRRALRVVAGVVWGIGHQDLDGLGSYCRICDHETTAHHITCPVLWVGRIL